MTKALLLELNTFRAADDKKPLAAWKGARHIPELDAYREAAKAKAEPKAKAAKGQTKKAFVADMLVKGTTIEQIEAELQIGPIAARSLIGDVRRMGIAVTRDESGTYRAA